MKIENKKKVNWNLSYHVHGDDYENNDCQYVYQNVIIFLSWTNKISWEEEEEKKIWSKFWVINLNDGHDDIFNLERKENFNEKQSTTINWPSKVI